MTSNNRFLVIGGSAGSIDIILRFLPDIKYSDVLSIIIVLHRKNTNDSVLSSLLSSKTSWKVKEAGEKEMALPHTIYLAPPDYHLLLEKDGTFSLDASEKVNYSRPSIDITFECAAEIYGSKLTCLLLSGANADGVEGLKNVKKNNGTVAIQDPAEAEISFMPQQALIYAEVDYVLKNKDIATFINNLSL